KTKPIRLEEFKPEQDWWGIEDNDFADRVENEFAWKVDFKTRREQAEAAASPHWQRAEQLNNEASAFENQARELKNSLVGTTNVKNRAKVESKIADLRAQAEPLRLQARD